MDWKLELIILPVSDVDRAKAFYVDQVGFNADYDRVVTKTCGSSSSPRRARPARSRSARASCMESPVGEGSADRRRRRAGGPRPAGAAGVEVGDVQHLAWGDFVFFSDPDGNAWSVQQLPERFSS